MAQCCGSGKSHETKAREGKALLQHAIEVYRSKETETERETQAKNVIRLAAKLLNARIGATKARFNATSPIPSDCQLAKSREAKIQGMVDGGIHCILAEFNASDIGQETSPGAKPRE